jgi:hypothetical protein
MSRFGLKFGILRRHPPFDQDADHEKPVLTAVLGAIKNAFATVMGTLNDVWDGRWIATADTESLDEHGDAMNVPRYDGEADDNWAVELSGADADYVKVDYAASLDFSDALTVDIRFKLDDLTSARIVYSRSVDEQEIHVLIDGKVRWKPKSTVTCETGAGAITTGTWYHVRATYDVAGNAEVYVGESGGKFSQKASVAAAGNLGSGAWDLYVGRRNGAPANPTDGVIDEVRAVGAVVPTVDGVTEVPEYLMPITDTKLLLHLDEGAGTAAADESGYDNDGELQGAAAWYSMAGNDWSGYRVRLDEAWKDAGEALTIEAIENAVELVGADFDPVLTVDDIQQRYEDRWLFYKALELGAAPGRLPFSVFGRGAPAPCPGELGRFTVVVVLSRVPTADEALELGAAVWDVKWAPARVLLVTDSGSGTYVLHREVYTQA